MASTTTTTTKEVAQELLPLVRVYKDGSVERLLGSPIVPPSLNDPQTQVSSKDISISLNPQISARLYLPTHSKPHNQNQKLPILVYFHGGGFCIESAFSFLHHRFLNHLVSHSQALLAVSVEYRLAPENPLPAAYHDSWLALQWVASHSVNDPVNDLDPWILEHGDLTKLYIGGDSAGGNIAHNVAVRAGLERLPGGVRVLGAFLSQPFFWGSERVGSEPRGGFEESVWEFVYPSAPGGVDNPMINPVGCGAPSLAGLGCERILVCVAGKDQLRERGVWYSEEVRKSGWSGKIELFEVDGEDHGFHFYYIDSQNAIAMIQRLASFLV